MMITALTSRPTLAAYTRVAMPPRFGQNPKHTPVSLITPEEADAFKAFCTQYEKTGNFNQLPIQEKEVAFRVHTLIDQGQSVMEALLNGGLNNGSNTAGLEFVFNYFPIKGGESGQLFPWEKPRNQP